MKVKDTKSVPSDLHCGPGDSLPYIHTLMIIRKRKMLKLCIEM